jgi:hypothetical protein
MIAGQHQMISVVDHKADRAVEIGTTAATRMSRRFMHDDGGWRPHQSRRCCKPG